MTGYEKIKKFVSEVHEINCALTDEIIEFIDEVILQEQVGNVAGIEPATALSAAQEELIIKCTRECRFKDVVNFDCCNFCDVENCVGRCEDDYNTCEDKNIANICEEICPVNAGVCSPLGCDMIKTEVNKILRQFETLADEMIKSNDGIESQSGLRLSNLIEKIENSNGLS